MDEFYAPGRESYHPAKRAGDQGHVGDQGLCLADSLVDSGSWSKTAFMSVWLELWSDYDDYFDHATKTVLANVNDGIDLVSAGSKSDELAGPGRMAPLLAWLANDTEASYLNSAIEQTLLTHNSEDAKEAATFLAQASYRLLRGDGLESTIDKFSPRWAMNAAEEQLEKDSVEAIGEIGRACPIKASLPAVIYLVLKHGEDLPKAFSENAMAGGDNCARGLALGILLGAYHGKDAIPTHWLQSLNNLSRIERVLACHS